MEVNRLKQKALKEYGLELFSGLDSLGNWTCYYIKENDVMSTAIDCDQYEDGDTELEAVKKAYAEGIK